jgi:hypothetical protein
MKWPFKHIKQKSSWPMQPLVVQFAGAVLQAPPDERVKYAGKMIERAVRIGARLAVEFGMPPTVFVKVAEDMMIKEGGKAAQQALQAVKAEKAVEAMELAEEAAESVQEQLGAIFGKGTKGEA